MDIPQHGERTEDGQHWFDQNSNSWQPVAGAAGSGESESSEQEDQGGDDAHSGITKVAAMGQLDNLMGAAEQDVTEFA